ncbi:ATP-binding protein [Ramlibacter sp. AN1133]|uniref:ATP-binding protein n=1 Tax=Ramlibacter sp. AN1133 TaxID=3133429 RepID=UPI0030BAC1E2
MPHRLRRIIGINLRTPRDQGTSCRIVDLDTRGAVMALGANGVGKTSFLRLLPLFYGAQPSRILRGSGHESMMRHMLPEPSSCVVFEYERDSEVDLRCTVVHCAPDEDAPQFHIIKAGFDERFFTREDGSGWVFLKRDEFKSQTEGLGFEVSPALSLSQYRCVILGDKAETRDMVRFRRLAAEHSLAPGMLRGLDQIAAAMGPEALSFNTLQEIVTGRIAARLGAEGKSMRELKKPAKDVSSWLVSQDHLSKVEAKRPLAVELAKACQAIQGLNLELSQMRAAAEALIEQKQAAMAANRVRRGRVVEQGEQEATGLASTAAAAKAAYDEQVSAVDALQHSVRSIEQQQEHYRVIGITDLEAEHDREAALLEQKTEAETEKASLDSQAQGILASADERKREIEAARSAVQQRVAQRQAELASALTRRLEELRLDEIQAQETTSTPARLGELPGLLQDLARQQGELQQAIKNPSASQEMQQALAAVRRDLRVARGADLEARTGLASAQRALQEAERDRDRKLREHEAAQATLTARRGQVEDLEGRQQPKAGSLLEFLRATAPDDLRSLARVIDPKLLHRTDLAPRHDPDAAGGEAGTVAVGTITVAVQGVEVPDWLDEPELRRQIERAREALQRAAAEEQEALKLARRAGATASEASEGEARARARAAAAHDAVVRLEQQDSDLQDQAEAELVERKDALTQELAAVRTAIGALTEEQRLLTRELAEQRRKLSAEFDAQRTSARQENTAAGQRLDKELTDANERAAQGVQRIDLQAQQELTAAGVDATRVQAVSRTIGELGLRLLAISQNRHEVTAWRVFRDREMVRLPGEQVRLAQARDARGAAQARWSQAQEAVSEHASQVRDELDRVDHEHRSAGDEVASLQSLLSRELLVIIPPSGSFPVSTWLTEDLLREVGRRNSELATNVGAANGHIRAIRQAMQVIEGPATEWLARKETELPELQDLASHLDALRRGRMLCEWYDTDYTSAVVSLRNELTGVLGQARQFVKDLDDFDREIGRFNRELQDQMSRVTRFPSFGNLKIGVRSTVKSLEYIGDLQRMKDLADSRQSLSRASSAPMARDLELPGAEEVLLMRKLRDLLSREGGIRTSLNELVRLECSLQVNGRERTIGREDEFKRYASNGQTMLIVALFLMGFASMVRKDAGGNVRVTWICDEVGRIDSFNLKAFLDTLDENHIDVISAAPEASGGAAEMFDRLARFYPNGNIVTADCEALHVV